MWLCIYVVNVQFCILFEIISNIEFQLYGFYFLAIFSYKHNIFTIHDFILFFLFFNHDLCSSYNCICDCDFIWNKHIQFPGNADDGEAIS